MNFPIQRYNKFALALAYFPESGIETAVHHLCRWIKQNTGLSDALTKTGYQARQRHFTARQTELIFEYLGEP